MDVSIKATTEGFEDAKRKIEGAADSLDKLGKKTEDTSESLDGFKVAATAAATVLAAGVTYAATKAWEKLEEGVSTVRELGDKLNSLSQTTGLSVEKLGAMKLVAETSNSSLEAFANGISQFNRHIDDATKGTGASADAFARLGISLKDNQGNLKSTDQLFGEFADKMSSFADGSGKTAIAMELLGRAGKDLVPLLNEGSEGFRKLEEEARKAGIVMSAETAKAAQELNQNMAVLKAYGEGFWREIASPIVAGLAEITRYMRDLRNEGDGVIAMFLGGFARASSLAIFGSPKGNLAANRAKEIELIAQIRRVEAGEGNIFEQGAGTAHLYKKLQEVYAERTGLEGQVAVEDPNLFNPSGTKTTPPPRSGKPDKERSLESTYGDAKRQMAEWVKVNYLSAEEAGAAWQNFYDGWSSAAEGNSKVGLQIEADRIATADKSYQAQVKTIDGVLKAQEDAQKESIKLMEDQQKAQNALDKEDERTMKEVRDIMGRYAMEDIANINKQVYLTRNDHIAALEALKRKNIEMGDAGTKGVEDVDNALRKLQTDEKWFSEELAKMFAVSVPQAILQTVKTIEGSLSNSIYQFVTGAKSLGDALKGFFSSVAQSIIKMFADIAAKKILESLIPTSLWSSFGLSAAGSAAGSTVSGAAGAAGGQTILSAGGAALQNGWSALTGGGSVGASEAAWYGGSAATGGAAATGGTAAGSTAAGSSLTAASFMETAGPAAFVAAGLQIFFGEGGIFGHHDTTDYRTPEQKAMQTSVEAEMEKMSLDPLAPAVVNWLMGNTGGPRGDYAYSKDPEATKAMIAIAIKELDAMSWMTKGVEAGASGLDTLVTRPTLFLAGEAGSERVTVSPLSGAARNGIGRAGGITINGPAMFDEYTFRRFKRMMAAA
jgi:hypothetical protein